MTNQNKKEIGLLFYGNTHIPLSIDCSGCHFFRFECSGSVNNMDCPIGQVKDMTPSMTAAKILSNPKVDDNHYLLARIAGFDLNEDRYKEHIDDLKEKVENAKNVSGREKYVKALKKSLLHYSIAFEAEESFVQALRDEYQTEDLLMVDENRPPYIYEEPDFDNEPDTANKVNNSTYIRVEHDPFEDATVVISDEDLPF